jgi:hypothetical protein
MNIGDRVIRIAGFDSRPWQLIKNRGLSDKIFIVVDTKGVEDLVLKYQDEILPGIYAANNFKRVDSCCTL